MEITTKGATLNVERIGERVDFPTTFILPGGPGADLATYGRYGCLQTVTNLVFHDPRGCGKSSTGDPSTYNMENYIEDVEAIRRSLGLNKIILLGKSYGSMCALGYTLRYPAHVSKLILAAGSPSYRFLQLAKKNIARIGTPEQIRITEKLFAGGFRDETELLQFFKLTNPLYALSAKIHPDKFDLDAKIKHFAVAPLNEGFKRNFWHFDYVDDLGKIKCPTLVLAGRHDWINDISLAEQMVRGISGSRLKIFENASHAMEADAGDEFFQTIKAFI